jgi:hypothetical protein
MQTTFFHSTIDRVDLSSSGIMFGEQRNDIGYMIAITTPSTLQTTLLTHSLACPSAQQHNAIMPHSYTYPSHQARAQYNPSQ